MKDFIHTGLHKPTMTTVDDPNLKVIEVDDGLSWTIKFYNRMNLIDVVNLIDVIDLEHPKGSPIHNSVRTLKVYNEDGVYLGTVEERGLNAIEVFLPEPLEQ